jgi:hypothetical protein
MVMNDLLDFSSMKIYEVRRFAKKLGLDVKRNMKKEELIALISAKINSQKEKKAKGGDFEMKIKNIKNEKCLVCGKPLFATNQEWECYRKKVLKAVESRKVKPEEVVLRRIHPECRAKKQVSVQVEKSEKKESLSVIMQKVDLKLVFQFFIMFLLGFLVGILGCLRG